MIGFAKQKSADNVRQNRDHFHHPRLKPCGCFRRFNKEKGFTRMFKYQKDKTYFAQISEGVDTIAAVELDALGATQIQPGYRGFHFSADPGTLYRVNYLSRLLSRVLAPLHTFSCRDRDDLYRAGRSVEWHRIFPSIAPSPCSPTCRATTRSGIPSSLLCA